MKKELESKDAKNKELESKLGSVESKLDKLTNAVLSKNDLFRAEHPGDPFKEINEQLKKEDKAKADAKKDEVYPVYNYSNKEEVSQTISSSDEKKEEKQEKPKEEEKPK